MPISKSRVDKAGAAMRAWWNHEDPPELGPPEHDALDVIWEYRRQFQYPTTKVASNLRYYTSLAKAEFVVTQRWKRLPRIIEKLTRHPKMRLSQMQDVGGCRAVLPDQTAVSDVLDRFAKNWSIITIDDYVKDPRPTGYRAVHAIVERDNLPIEVQLRTYGQQDWADEIERIDSLVSYALKDGEGPTDILDYARLLAEVIAANERGEAVDRPMIMRLTTLARCVP